MNILNWGEKNVYLLFRQTLIFIWTFSVWHSDEPFQSNIQMNLFSLTFSFDMNLQMNLFKSNIQVWHESSDEPFQSDIQMNLFSLTFRFDMNLQMNLFSLTLRWTFSVWHSGLTWIFKWTFSVWRSGLTWIFRWTFSVWHSVWHEFSNEPFQSDVQMNLFSLTFRFDMNLQINFSVWRLDEPF